MIARRFGPAVRQRIMPTSTITLKPLELQTIARLAHNSNLKDAPRETTVLIYMRGGRVCYCELRSVRAKQARFGKIGSANGPIAMI